MDKAAEVARIDKERVEVRLTPSELCRRANMARSTWWRVNADPEKLTLPVLGKLEQAIAVKRAEMAKA